MISTAVFEWFFGLAKDPAIYGKDALHIDLRPATPRTETVEQGSTLAATSSGEMPAARSLMPIIRNSFWDAP